MIKEDRDILFDELCNDFSSVEAGVRLHVWNSLDVYKFGLINIMQHDQIVRAINRNLDLFISDLKDNDSYEVLDNVLKDFEIIESVTRKRFLGFLWYCKKLESRKIDVVSHNPNTTIKNVSYTKIVQ